MYLFVFSQSYLLSFQLCKALSNFTQVQPDSTLLPAQAFLVEHCRVWPMPTSSQLASEHSANGHWSKWTNSLPFSPMWDDPKNAADKNSQGYSPANQVFSHTSWWRVQWCISIGAQSFHASLSLFLAAALQVCSLWLNASYVFSGSGSIFWWTKA